MDHVAIDLGGRESQICVRSSEGEILEEDRRGTRSLGKYLARRPPSRVVMETCGEAFAVAEEARAAGHEVVVVPAMLVRSLGVGHRGIKTDVRDARNLSEASCRMGKLPAVHVPSRESRQRKAMCSMREALIEVRTKLVNAVRGWTRSQGLGTVRSGAPTTFSTRVRELAKSQSTEVDGGRETSWQARRRGCFSPQADWDPLRDVARRATLRPPTPLSPSSFIIGLTGCRLSEGGDRDCEREAPPALLAEDLVDSIATCRRISTYAAPTANSRLRQPVPTFLLTVLSEPRHQGGTHLPLTGQPLHSRSQSSLWRLFRPCKTCFAGPSATKVGGCPARQWPAPGHSSGERSVDSPSPATWHRGGWLSCSLLARKRWVASRRTWC